MSESYNLIGFGQGKFKIINDSKLGRIAQQNVEEMEFVNETNEGINLENVPLSKLRQRLHELQNKAK